MWPSQTNNDDDCLFICTVQNVWNPFSSKQLLPGCIYRTKTTTTKTARWNPIVTPMIMWMRKIRLSHHGLPPPSKWWTVRKTLCNCDKIIISQRHTHDNDDDHTRHPSYIIIVHAIYINTVISCLSYGFGCYSHYVWSSKYYWCIHLHFVYFKWEQISIVDLLSFEPITTHLGTIITTTKTTMTTVTDIPKFQTLKNESPRIRFGIRATRRKNGRSRRKKKKKSHYWHRSSCSVPRTAAATTLLLLLPLTLTTSTSNKHTHTHSLYVNVAKVVARTKVFVYFFLSWLPVFCFDDAFFLFIWNPQKLQGKSIFLSALNTKLERNLFLGSPGRSGVSVWSVCTTGPGNVQGKNKNKKYLWNTEIVLREIVYFLDCTHKIQHTLWWCL